jgi:hypothetical protein
VETPVQTTLERNRFTINKIVALPQIAQSARRPCPSPSGRGAGGEGVLVRNATDFILEALIIIGATLFCGCFPVLLARSLKHGTGKTRVERQ